MYILNFQMMIEIPESQTVARQVRETLAGRTVTGVFNATHPHKFTWYTGDPLEYPMLLTGRKIVGAEGCGHLSMCCWRTTCTWLFRTA